MTKVVLADFGTFATKMRTLCNFRVPLRSYLVDFGVFTAKMRALYTKVIFSRFWDT